MDFVADALSNRRRFRILTLIDCCSREALALHADYALPSRTVTEVLDRVIAMRGAPKIITTDTGPEFTSGLGFELTLESGLTSLPPGESADPVRAHFKYESERKSDNDVVKNAVRRP